jgi:hypothetical protein
MIHPNGGHCETLGMATISELTFVERVVLPFCTLVPATVGLLGYWVWKRDKTTEDERMSERLSYWFAANCAGMLGLAIYHVLRNVLFIVDYRLGMTAFGVGFLVFVTLGMQFNVLQLDPDSEILLDEDNEVADYLAVDARALAQLGPEQARVGYNVPRRRYIAIMTYLVIVVQSGFDGLVLKYNPNAQASLVQVVMFFVSKCVESIVVSTALIHAGIRTRSYILFMFNYTVSVALSTLSAYDLVSNIMVIAIFEHPVFQMGLGASGGLLLCLSVYFLHMESLRKSVGKRWITNLVFIATFAAAAVTGMFG